MPIIFECEKDQISRKPEDITEHTKAYVGKLEPGIFNLIQQYNIENIYTSFPEGRIRKEHLEIGGKTTIELEQELKEKGFKISSNAKDMLHSKDFTVLEEKEDAVLIRIKVKDLGFPNGATTDEIYQKAEELGLELCPAEAGPHYRLKYTDQPMGEWIRMGMKQITGRGGRPDVFRLGCAEDDGMWLNDNWAEPDDGWFPGNAFVFRLSKLKNSET